MLPSGEEIQDCGCLSICRTVEASFKFEVLKCLCFYFSPFFSSQFAFTNSLCLFVSLAIQQVKKQCEETVSVFMPCHLKHSSCAIKPLMMHYLHDEYCFSGHWKNNTGMS